MHIGFVTETYPPEVNGVAMTLSRLIGALEQRGHRLHIVRPRQEDERLQEDSTVSQTLTRGLPLPGYRELRLGLPAARRLKQLWLKSRPDIVYVATEGPLGLSAIQTARRLQIPVVSGFHTNFHTYSNHYGVGWLKPVIFSYLKYLHNRTACTLAPARDQVRELEQLGIHNVALLSRGVDARLFNPERRNYELRASWGAGDETLVMTYVGRLAAEKNLPLLIRALRAVRRQQPDALLVLVGDGPMRKSLQKEAGVVLAGIHSGEDLASHYASSDLFLFASESETFGNVTLEAMASGLPSVTYDYAASAMHIEQGVHGLKAPLGDDTGFINATCQLAASRPLREQLGQAARMKATDLDWPAIVRQFESILVTYAKQSDSDQHQPVPAA